MKQLPVAPMRLAAAWTAHAAMPATGHDPQPARTKRALPFAHSTVARRWRRLMLLLLLLGALPAQAIPPAGPAPQRVTRAGPLLGTAQDGIVAFKGIPYAAPPTGPLRWQPPQPVAGWTVPRDATRHGPACPQPPTAWMEALPQSEDCLTLNLWAPAQGARLPVAVWIHGGGGTAGSGAQPTFDGTAFARDGVVLVTLNYRLGVLGFFAHPQLPAGGNFAYMDMIAALHWVRDNIAAFGGDPGLVTVMGESAGGMAVTALMVSPQARGLFAGAISQSAGEAHMRPVEEALAAGSRLARAAGAGDLATLRALPAEALVALAPTAADAAPMLDGITVTAQPAAAFAAGHAAPVPLLVGANDREEAALDNLPPQEAQQRLDALLAAYPAQAEAAARAYDIARAGPVESLVRIRSDAGYVEPARHYARQHPAAWATGSPTSPPGTAPTPAAPTTAPNCGHRRLGPHRRRPPRRGRRARRLGALHPYPEPGLAGSCGRGRAYRRVHPRRPSAAA